MAPKAPRRGSTNNTTAEAAFMTGDGRKTSTVAEVDTSKNPNGPRNLTKHRLVQHGIWAPAGATTRILYAANSDAGCSLDGARKTNQDSFIMHIPDPKGKTALFGVFDGHGENGHLVSRNCRAQYADMFKSNLAKRGDPDAAVKAAYIELDQHCNGECDCSQSGMQSTFGRVRWAGMGVGGR